jgi:hypothetical protein
MRVAGHNEVGTSGNGAFENPVVRWIGLDYLN